jgi:hypothetical protein
MAAACAAATKRMPTKNLEINMVLWVCNWLVDVLEKNPSSILYLFSHFLRAREAISRRRLSPPPRSSGRFALLLPSLARHAAPVRSLSSFSLQFHSSSSHLAGNPISSPQFHYPSALADVRSHIGPFYCSQPRFALCLHSLRSFVRRILLSLGNQSPVASSITRGPWSM